MKLYAERPVFQAGKPAVSRKLMKTDTKIFINPREKRVVFFQKRIYTANNSQSKALLQKKKL